MDHEEAGVGVMQRINKAEFLEDLGTIEDRAVEGPIIVQSEGADMFTIISLFDLERFLRLRNDAERNHYEGQE